MGLGSCSVSPERKEEVGGGEGHKGKKQEQVDEMQEDEVKGANLGASILFNVYSFETRPTCAVNIAADCASRIARR